MTRCNDWRFNLPADDSELRRLHEEGYSPKEAADKTGTHKDDVAKFFSFIDASRQPGDNYL